MRTTVIPAQITTVEDRIAGNLNLTQMILLIIPILWTMIIYILLFPTMGFALYKLPLIVTVTLFCLILAIRIKGKVMIHWLIILLRYNVRPKYYLYNKNDSFLRNLFLPVFEKKQRKLFTKSPAKQEKRARNTNITLGDLAKLEVFLTNPKYAFSIKLGKKGGLNVALEQNRQ